MSIILTRIRDLLAREDGPTAVEYAVMLALILLAGFVAYTSFGTTVSSTFSTIGSTVTSNGT
jgi:pilus assembly protein Flp/PilA